jgi:integrase/recombinase XerD
MVSDVVPKEERHQRMRSIPIDGETLDMLKDYINQGGSVSRDGRELLFGINRHRAWQIVRECAQRAGLPELVYSESGKPHGVSPHRLRDAFAVNAVKLDDSGDGLRMLQEQLGHKSISTTMGYRKLSGAEQREWYDKLFP